MKPNGFIFLCYNKYIESGISHMVKLMKKDKEYTAKLDSKKRVVLRGAKYDYYEVKEYPNGKIVLEPRVLSNPQLKKTDGESVVE